MKRARSLPSVSQPSAPALVDTELRFPMVDITKNLQTGAGRFPGGANVVVYSVRHYSIDDLLFVLVTNLNSTSSIAKCQQAGLRHPLDSFHFNSS